MYMAGLIYTELANWEFLPGARLVRILGNGIPLIGTSISVPGSISSVCRVWIMIVYHSIPVGNCAILDHIFSIAENDLVFVSGLVHALDRDGDNS